MTHQTDNSIAPSTNDKRQDLSSGLRQMIAVLQDERQALATLKADTLLGVTRQKQGLCEKLARLGAEVEAGGMDEETRALAQTAKSLNEVNRRVRNLLAANVSGRLEALGGERHAYSANPGTTFSANAGLGGAPRNTP